ncbi:hypothetical protein ACMDCR_10190 [Labrys okinawensis]|uniref:hypothetical protein n=1 Tax=Labrys okinawensis TaxID=346911 RepID=UPI0039BC89D0
MKSNALSRLLDGIAKPSHDRRPSIETFPDIDTDRLAKQMDLAGRGRERGANNEPPTSVTAPDQIEAEIVERIEAVKKSSHALIEDELRTYAERLAALDFEDRFTQIQHAAPAAVGDFKLEARAGKDDLYALRRNLRDLDAEQQAFRRRNKIEHTARVQGGATTFLKIAILVVLFLVEAIANGNFLSKGNELGLLGGLTEAFAFAALNIVGTVIIGLYGIKQITHISISRRAIGFISVLFYLVFSFCLNLALAHYREVSGTILEGAGAEVVRRLASRPFELQELNSWILFALGLLFSLIALIDSLTFSDSYPGYSDVQRRLEAAREDYRRTKADLGDTLREVRDEYQERMEEISRDLSVRRSEYEAIVANRSRMIKLFVQHQEHLERAANVLLGIYREANKASRPSKTPKRFDSTFSLPRIQIDAHADGEWSARELRSRIGEIHSLLISEVKEIHAYYQATMDEYRQLDDIVPEPGERDGAQPA